ncbi:MAG: oligosaccharide repeat unit polymerase [Clostridia bacterium]|nr:oligosaccharide repeat unit polymerase [Clostridia bacterium]
MREYYILLSLVLFIVVFFWGVIRFSEKESALSTYFVFSVGVIVYFLIIPLEMWIKKSDIFYISGYKIDLPSHIVFVFVQSALALPAFMIGLYAGNFNLYSINSVKCSELNLKKRQALIVLFLVLVFIIFYFDYLFMSFSDYFYTSNLHYSDPLYSLLKYVLLSLLCFYGVLFFFKRSYSLGFLLLLIVFMFGFFTNDKNPMLMSLLSFAAYAVRNIRDRIPVVVFLVGMLPVVLLLSFLVRLFSFLRAGYSLYDSVFINLKTFSFASIDPAGPYVSVAESFKINNFEFGYTYIQNFISLIPKLIYPSRPPDLAETFAKEMILDWSEGRGLGFSPLAEAYINFGYLAFVHFFIFGVIWALQWRLFFFIWKRFAPRNMFPVFYKVFGLYMLILSFRGSSLHLIKIMPMYFLVSLLFIFLIKSSVKKRNENFMGA